MRDEVPVMQVHSASTEDVPVVGTWSAFYPPIGSVDAVATIEARGDGGFSISVEAVGWAEENHPGPAAVAFARTLSEARALADRMAVELLGREVVAVWRGPGLT